MSVNAVDWALRFAPVDARHCLLYTSDAADD